MRSRCTHVPSRCADVRSRCALVSAHVRWGCTLVSSQCALGMCARHMRLHLYEYAPVMRSFNGRNVRMRIYFDTRFADVRDVLMYTRLMCTMCGCALDQQCADLHSFNDVRMCAQSMCRYALNQCADVHSFNVRSINDVRMCVYSICVRWMCACALVNVRISTRAYITCPPS